MSDYLILLIVFLQILVLLIACANLHYMIRYLVKSSRPSSDMADVYKSIFQNGKRSYMPHEARGILKEKEIKTDE